MSHDRVFHVPRKAGPVARVNARQEPLYGSNPAYRLAEKAALAHKGATYLFRTVSPYHSQL